MNINYDNSFDKNRIGSWLWTHLREWNSYCCSSKSLCRNSVAVVRDDFVHLSWKTEQTKPQLMLWAIACFFFSCWPKILRNFNYLLYRWSWESIWLEEKHCKINAKPTTSTMWSHYCIMYFVVMSKTNWTDLLTVHRILNEFKTDSVDFVLVRQRSHDMAHRTAHTVARL